MFFLIENSHAKLNNNHIELGRVVFWVGDLLQHMPPKLLHTSQSVSDFKGEIDGTDIPKGR